MEATSIAKEFAKEDVRARTALEALNSTPNHLYSLGCPVIDIFVGGGLPSGKIVEVFGWESTGKSTVALEFAFSFIDYWKNKGDENFLVLWVETESVFDKARVELMAPGKLKYFIVSEAETVEDCHELIKKYLEKCRKSKTKLFIVWDTLAAAQTRAQKATGNRFGGGQGEFPQSIRFMLRDLVRPLGETDSTLVLVNQIGKSFTPGVADESPGGGAPKFFSSLRFKTRRMSDHMDPTSIEPRKIGIQSELKTVKNKIVSVDQSISVTIIGERGIDKWDTTVRYLKERKIVPVGATGWTTVVYPEQLYKPGNPISLKAELNKDGEPITDGWTFHRFNSIKKLTAHIEAMAPHLKDWMDYLIYLDRALVSPLLKMKLIERIWAYEEKFFGVKVTPLTEEEKRLASILAIQYQESIKVEELKAIDLPDVDPLPEPKAQKSGTLKKKVK